MKGPLLSASLVAPLKEPKFLSRFHEIPEFQSKSRIQAFLCPRQADQPHCRATMSMKVWIFGVAGGGGWGRAVGRKMLPILCAGRQVWENLPGLAFFVIVGTAKSTHM